MGIRSGSDTGLQQRIVAIDRHDGIDHEGDEAQVVLSILTGREEIDTRVGAHRPVAVLARSVHPLEGLLVQQHPEIMAACHPLHERHQQLVMVVRQVTLLIDRCQLKLIRSHLVVARLHRNTQGIALPFQVLHELLHPRGNRPEIVVV